MSDVTSTLAERGTRYGEFDEQANYAQDMKEILRRSPNWENMENDQREGLDMIANKIARILNGDPNYADSWHDIAGYAQLVEKRLSRVITIEVPERTGEFKVGDKVRFIGSVRNGKTGTVQSLFDDKNNWLGIVLLDGEALTVAAFKRELELVDGN